jgi:predicted ATP-grasp superfamily ATP-dependent carboligase
VTRCLIHAGLNPVVFGWHRLSPLSLVPGCTYIPLPEIKWTNGELDPSVVASANEACRRYRIDRLVPLDFPSIALFAEYGTGLTAARLSALPDADTVRTLHNKWAFAQLVAELGLPQPRTELARTLSELRQTRLAFPIITKPVDRWASVGFQRHDTFAALERTLMRGALSAEFPLLVQEFISGKDVGFAFIARRGRLLSHAAFEQPRPGYRRYFNAPDLTGHVAKLVAHTGYHGVGEVDARYDPSRNEFRLLEVNPRFWASLLYAAHAGMNFPQHLLRLDDEHDGSGFTAQTHDVTLSSYEFVVGKAVQLSERAHSTVNRWRGI